MVLGGSTHVPDSASSSAQSLVGSTVGGRYKVERLLGEGGMGAVYLVEHILMRKKLALKVLHHEMCAMPEVVARFEREALAAAHIEHPNVAPATDFGRTDDGALFLVLEYIDGQSLRVALDSAAPFPFERAIRITRQIADALSRAHALGIVHRDLKPENIMLVARGGDSDFVKVLDFGIARVPVEMVGEAASAPGSHPLTRLGVVFGTPEYMAPEQARGEAIDARADLYALGVTLYEMLCGRRPFEAESTVMLLVEQATATAPPLRAKAPNVDVPEAVEQIVMRLLAKDPQARHGTALDLIAALDAVAPTGRSSLGSLPGRASANAEAHSIRTGAGAAFLPTTLAADFSGAPAWRRVKGALEVVHARLPAPLRRFPPVPLAAIAMAAFLIGVTLASVAALSTSTRPADAAHEKSSVTAVSAGPRAKASALKEATAGGAQALEALGREYPTDPAISRALVRVHAQSAQTELAMRAVGKLLAQDPSAAADAEILGLVTAAAASGKDGADAAFELLEGPFGSHGVDALLELASKQTGSKGKLAQRLAKPDVRANASPAALVVLDLRAATSCDAKREALARASENGDARALVLLRQLVPTRGCGFLGTGDCWKCLRKDNALRDAVAAIEARSKVQ